MVMSAIGFGELHLEFPLGKQIQGLRGERKSPPNLDSVYSKYANRPLNWHIANKNRSNKSGMGW